MTFFTKRVFARTTSAELHRQFNSASQCGCRSYASRVAPTRHHLKAWLEAAISGTPPFLLPTPPPVASALEQRDHPRTSARCACAQRGAINIQNYSRPQWLADGPTELNMSNLPLKKGGTYYQTNIAGMVAKVLQRSYDDSDHQVQVVTRGRLLLQCMSWI